MASKTFYACGCMEQGDQYFRCERHKDAPDGVTILDDSNCCIGQAESQPPPAARLDLDAIDRRIVTHYDGYTEMTIWHDFRAAVSELKRLRASSVAGEARLRELAREGAKRAHLTAVMSGHHVKVFAETGHQWLGGGDTWQGFSCCPHPDCALMRAAPLPEKETT